MATKPWIDVRRGIWYGRFRLEPGGPWRQVSLGKHPAGFSPSKPPKVAPREVMDRWNELEAKEHRIKLGLESGKRSYELEDYFKAYLAIYSVDRRPASVQCLDTHSSLFLAYAKSKGVHSVEQVTKVVCREFMEARLLAGTMPSSIRSQRGYLSAIFTRAVEDEILAVNPWSLAKLPAKAIDSEPTFWNSEEVSRIIAAAKPDWIADLIIVLANTGIRSSACIAMEWNWIHWDEGYIEIPAHANKGRKAYKTPLTDLCRETLAKRWPATEGSHVFPISNGGRRASYNRGRYHFLRAVKEAGVKTGTLHDLRHTFGRLLAMRAPVTVVQGALGHSSLAMTQRYTKVGGEEGVKFIEGFGIGGKTEA